jgi:fructose-bisphosphate aldolase, class I
MHGFLFAGNRGILGLDEGLDRLRDRFISARFPWNHDSQRKYLELMIESPGLKQYLNAITLSDYSAQLLDSNAELFATKVINTGFVLGIRADLGYDRSSLLKREQVTRGLVGLDARMTQYKQWGASYTLWRNKYYITTNTPTQSTIELNNQEALEFVTIALKHKLVPIVQVKISTNSNQSVEATRDVMQIVLEDLFARAEIMSIEPSSFVLQTNFVTPGKFSEHSFSPQDVARETVQLLKNVLPADIGGVSFVGDGLRPGFARVYLEEFKKLLKKQKKSYPVTFSFGRGLHDSAIQAWGGDSKQRDDAQVSLVQNSRMDWMSNS